MTDILYEVYCGIRKNIINLEACINKNSMEDLIILKEAKESQEILELATPLLLSRWNRDQEMFKSFTPEQIDFICYQIGDWYLMMKPLLEGRHNLGYMKEKLKTMICGEGE